MAGNVYSFLDVQAAIVGPGGTINLGAGAGIAEEGISVDFAEDIDSMQIGADGNGQHSLHANRSGTLTVRLLKTSPTNSLLSAMLAFQRASPTTHGQNTITISDVNRGDLVTAQQVAFARTPPLTYANQAGLVEWVFNAIRIDYALGL